MRKKYGSKLGDFKYSAPKKIVEESAAFSSDQVAEMYKEVRDAYTASRRIEEYASRDTPFWSSKDVITIDSIYYMVDEIFKPQKSQGENKAVIPIKFKIKGT